MKTSQNSIYFYPRSPCGERRRRSVKLFRQNYISIHALLAESDTSNQPEQQEQREFLSTLSLRRATIKISFLSRLLKNFYPRSPCGERRYRFRGHAGRNGFLSTLSLRRATDAGQGTSEAAKFLSTLSLRRATIRPRRNATCGKHFYPRSPCGERLLTDDVSTGGKIISIHALLAESDTWARGSRATYVEFLSTLSLRRATTRQVDRDSITR